MEKDHELMELLRIKDDMIAQKDQRIRIITDEAFNRNEKKDEMIRVKDEQINKLIDRIEQRDGQIEKFMSMVNRSMPYQSMVAEPTEGYGTK
jgi:hypothetical protein